MALPTFLENPDPYIYFSDNFVVLDFETTNIDKGDPTNADNSILLTCYRRGKVSNKHYYTWGNEYTLGRIVEEAERADFIVAHNAKFELGWLKRAGANLTRVLVFDTQTAEYVIRSNRSWRLGLDATAQRYGIGGKESLVSKLIKGGICPSEIPASLLEKYCNKDVDLTYELFLKQREILRDEGLLNVFFTRCLFTPVLADIEFNGMCLDCERVEEEVKAHHKEAHELRREIDDITGGINTNSPKQLAEFLYDRLGFSELTDRRGYAIRTAANGRKTDVATIAKLKANNKHQRRFLDLLGRLSKKESAIQKNLDFFYGVCKERDGIFKANFNQTVTATQRLSSSGKKTKFNIFKKEKAVQFQNLPRAFKRLFKARKKGWKIGEADGAQLEFRTAAFLGQDKVATDAIKERFDVHSFTARVLTNAGQPTERQQAKAHTFKPLFGGQSGTKAEQEYYRAFRERYPDITATQDRWVQSVLRDKQLTTCTGLKFYWPDTKMTASGYITNTPSICNYPVQSLATADIIPIAVTYQWHRMRAAGMKSFIVNTIHDSSITEVAPDEEKEYKEIAELSFTTDVYNYLSTVYNLDFNVPLEAEIKLKSHWGSD